MIPLAERSWDVVALGEALIDLLPSRVGPLAHVPSFERHTGGAPANVAIGAARLGARCAFVGAVGEDPFGTYLQDAFRAEGVDAAAVMRVEGRRTGVAFISLNEAGQPHFLSMGGGAELCVTSEVATRAPVEDARVFHLGSYILSAEPSCSAAMASVRRAGAAGTWVAFDPNLRLHFWRDHSRLRAAVDDLVPQSDVLKISSEECEFITGTPDPLQAAKILIKRGPRLVVVTTGALGCAYARRTSGSVETGTVPTRRAKVLDSTGAGDGFLAALLVGMTRRLIAGEDALEIAILRLEKLLALANEAGARVCEHVGAVPGLPRASEFPSLDV